MFKLKLERIFALLSIFLAMGLLAYAVDLVFEKATQLNLSFGLLGIFLLSILTYKITVMAVWRMEDIDEILGGRGA